MSASSLFEGYPCGWFGRATKRNTIHFGGFRNLAVKACAFRAAAKWPSHYGPNPHVSSPGPRILYQPFSAYPRLLCFGGFLRAFGRLWPHWAALGVWHAPRLEEWLRFLLPKGKAVLDKGLGFTQEVSPSHELCKGGNGAEPTRVSLRVGKWMVSKTVTLSGEHYHTPKILDFCSRV